MTRQLNRLLVTVLAMAFIVAACGSEDTAAPSQTATPPSSDSTPATTATTIDPDATSSTTAPPTTAAPEPIDYPEGITPARLEIPAIDVDAATVDLDLRGPEPEVPSNFGDTGWYEQTRLPGEIGPAVIAGHIDSRSGPAVFGRLDELQVGDPIIVHDDDGQTRTFIVTDMGQYPKEALPDEVFGFGDGVPELRVITCGGSFDSSIGHYRDNYVVYAQLEQP